MGGQDRKRKDDKAGIEMVNLKPKPKPKFEQIHLFDMDLLEVVH